ncbi:hypothetical protein PUNSTDRAFT_30965, partial [Punctularia strigosozonata HHB-11173 SS5]|uniref:uncharacterized protein n=1 Tax=Punctularia strigosozonata (strain HHB-11173) TaxID=741275 RepID=UPI0004417FA9
TPSKRMRIMHANLASTESGSFLVGHARVTAQNVLAPPTIQYRPVLSEPRWEMARAMANRADQTISSLNLRVEELRTELLHANQYVQALHGMIEGANAQLVVSSMHTMKLNQSLQSQDEAKKAAKKNKFLVGGMARHYTNESFIAEEERLAAEAKEREAQKEQREEARKSKRDAKEAFEEWWRQAKEKHERDRAEYEELKKKLRSEGVKQKDIPKAPQRPKRADYQREQEDPEDS